LVDREGRPLVDVFGDAAFLGDAFFGEEAAAEDDLGVVAFFGDDAPVFFGERAFFVGEAVVSFFGDAFLTLFDADVPVFEAAVEVLDAAPRFCLGVSFFAEAALPAFD